MIHTVNYKIDTVILCNYHIVDVNDMITYHAHMPKYQHLQCLDTQ